MHPDAYLEMATTEDVHWWFVGRRAILRDLVAELALPASARILEVGCGTGGNLRMLERFGRVSAVEMDPQALGWARERAAWQTTVHAGHCPDQLSGLQPPYDLICMFDVLEHIEEDQATLARLRGLLAPGGQLLLTVPAYRWMWSEHDEFLHHKRRYGRSQLDALLREAGLQVERLGHFNTLLFPLAAASRLLSILTGGSGGAERAVPWAPLNELLGQVFAAERHLVTRLSLPFGLSLLARARAL